MSAIKNKNYNPTISDFAINFFKQNSYAIALQILALFILLGNLWLATKLAPLAENVRRVETAQAINRSDISKLKETTQDIPVIEEKVSNLKDEMSLLRQDVKILLTRSE